MKLCTCWRHPSRPNPHPECKCDMRKRDTSISDFRPQAVNVNRHTERGLAMLEKSVQQDGWIGAITVAADGETFDGSARLETLSSVMPSTEPIIVETDGTQPIIVVRTDIPSADDPRAKRLGVAANSIAAMDYNPDGAILAMLAQEDAQIKQYAELDDAATKAILEAAQETKEAGGGTVDDIPSQFQILITCQNEDEQAGLLNRFIAEGVKCKALVS